MKYFSEIIILSIALAMDAAAATISITNAKSKQNNLRNLLIAPLLFGFFQGFMPLIGFFGTSWLECSWLDEFGNIIAGVILSLIAINMFWQHHEDKIDTFNLKIIFLLAILTSFDALFVGVGFGCTTRNNIFLDAIIIGLTTFIISVFCEMVIKLFHKKFSSLYERKSKIFGGIILLLLGIKFIISAIF